jgi:isoquinoline 1-oxidoreductase beta subunit
MLLAEELEIDLDADQIVAAPVGDAYVNPANGGQVTGTSNSVQDAWDKLRTAGAQARIMLISRRGANAGASILPANAAPNGTVVNARGKVLELRRARRGGREAAGAQGRQAQAERRFPLIGKSRARLDTPGKVDGSAEFGLDVKAARHAVCRARAESGFGRQSASVDSAPPKNAGVRQGDEHRERRGGGRRSFLAGAQGARCAEDHLGSGRQRGSTTPRSALLQENRRGGRRALVRAPTATRRRRSNPRAKTF